MTSAQPKSAGEIASRSAELYRRGRAAEFGISPERFTEILGGVVEKYAPADTGELLASLKVEELVLARACAAGHERAWEVFLHRYREKLYDAARGITHDDASARELADSLYADLYGTKVKDGGQRVSKLGSYTGRGSLEGWLRTVLAQEYVNRYRTGRRNVSLEEQEEEGHQLAAPEPEQSIPPEPRLGAAIDQALASLGAEERFILASYYLDGRTLAQTARMLRVHESTVSRKLEKITGSVRKKILDGLVAGGLSRRQAEEALQVDVRAVSVDLRRGLAQETAAPPFLNKESRK